MARKEALVFAFSCLILVASVISRTIPEANANNTDATPTNKHAKFHDNSNKIDGKVRNCCLVIPFYPGCYLWCKPKHT
ncbi:hypothetical protein HN873_039835 [Arachis hypogaea]|nr:uncharacterized protein DS421_12g371170 [Arachis hypogaea]